MKRSTDRILTSHVGSLIRPPASDRATCARWSGTAGAVDDAALRFVPQGLRRGGGRAARPQAGVDVVSDSESSARLSRLGRLHALERLGGFRAAARFQAWRQSGACAAPTSARFRRILRAMLDADATEPVTQRGTARPAPRPIAYTGQPALQRDIDNLKAALGKAQSGRGGAFLPVAAPPSAMLGPQERTLCKR